MPDVKKPTPPVPHFGEALLGEGLGESRVALELQMGQSTQTIQRQCDQPVISQVPDEGKAERKATVRVLLLVVSQPSRGLESHAVCLDCSLKCDAEMGLGAAWGPGSTGDKQR